MSSALAAVAGDAISAGISGHFNQSSAREQMRWQEKMSNTAYQRAAKDLEAAGLNRILAVGTPASSPSGASAQMPDSRMGSTYVAASTAKSIQKVNELNAELLKETTIKTHNEGLAAAEQAANIRAHTNKMEAETGVAGWSAKELEARIANLGASTGETVERTKGYGLQRQLAGAQVKMTDAQAEQFTQLARKLGIEADVENVKRAGWQALTPFIDYILSILPEPPPKGQKPKMPKFFDWLPF